MYLLLLRYLNLHVALSYCPFISPSRTPLNILCRASLLVKTCPSFCFSRNSFIWTSLCRTVLLSIGFLTEVSIFLILALWIDQGPLPSISRVFDEKCADNFVEDPLYVMNGFSCFFQDSLPVFRNFDYHVSWSRSH